MYTELVKEKLWEQLEVYQAFKNGDTSSVQYRESKDKEWGTSDANYLNRMRLSYYLLYAQMNDEIGSLDLMDCIFLSQDLDYEDVMEVLVDQWKASITDWTDADWNTLAGFHSFLGKERENEAIYKTLLENAEMSGEIFNIVAAYNKVIRYYIDICQFETAGSYMQKMIAATDFKEIEKIRLFGDVLEECFEIICGEVKDARDLWEWAKPYLQKRKNRYGDLYTKGISAAKTIHDDYAVQLEQEYMNWLECVKF